MGLCKCPKRKVTNQFCFEHRVNVCENCMVKNHPKCVIQSYLQWLQDSDCNPICTFCKESLSSRECCRLVCYHVYHWACLDLHYRSLPESKNPANYVCPTCNTRVIPQSNWVSPVADVLREKLARVNWARSLQGLPLLSFQTEEEPEQVRNVLEAENSLGSTYHNNIASSATARTSGSVATSNSIQNNAHSNNQKSGPPYSIVNMESNLVMQNSTPRKIFEAYDDPKDFSFDHDENKYQRKSALEWFLRWWKLIKRNSVRTRNVRGWSYKVLIIAGIALFICIIILFSKLGRMVTDGDPSYDPLYHPMINVEHNNDQN